MDVFEVGGKKRARSICWACKDVAKWVGTKLYVKHNGAIRKRSQPVEFMFECWNDKCSVIEWTEVYPLANDTVWQVPLVED